MQTVCIGQLKVSGLLSEFIFSSYDDLLKCCAMTDNIPCFDAAPEHLGHVSSSTGPDQVPTMVGGWVDGWVWCVG